MTLKEKRAQWEEGMAVVAEIPGPINRTTEAPGSLTVILKMDSWYYVYYYMQMGSKDKWDVSADASRVNGDSVVHALARRHPPQHA